MRLDVSGVLPRFRSRDRGRSGSTAVEFALIGLPFFMMLTAAFEAGLVTMAQQSLNTGVDAASRQVFSGVFQANADTTPAATRFKKLICDTIVYASCSSVLLEVTTSTTFAGSNPTNPYVASSRSVNAAFGAKFQCPAANNIVTVRAIAIVPRYFGFLTLNGLQLANKTQMVVATNVFRAEPYPSGTC